MVAKGYGRGEECGRARGHDSEGGRRHEIRVRVIVLNDRNNHTSDKCWDKFGKPEWAQVASTTTSTATSTLQIFHANYECFLQYKLLRHPSRLMVLCMGMLQLRVHLFLSLISLGVRIQKPPLI